MNSNCIFITGASGSCGYYLSEYIHANFPAVRLHGTSRKTKLKYGTTHYCDLTNYSSIFQLINEINPEYIIHLAADADVRKSWEFPAEILHNNIISTANLLTAIQRSHLQPKILICSTSEVYGNTLHEYINEKHPLNPISPYAISKLAQDRLAAVYAASYDLPIVITRMFSYINPRRINLAFTHFADQIAHMEKGMGNTLQHGNLASVRNWLDMNDCVTAYWAALTKGTAGEVYNIAGNTIASIGDGLNILRSFAKKEIPCELTPRLGRPDDIDKQLGNSKKFRKDTNWQPKCDFKKSLQELLNYRRNLLG